MTDAAINTSDALLPQDCWANRLDQVSAIMADDPVEHPHHYTAGSIECIDFIDSCGYGLDFCLANAIKYLTRCKLKGSPVQDIRKAIWYANHAADKLESGDYKVE